MSFKIGDRVIRIKGKREGQEATVVSKPYVDRDGDTMVPILFDDGSRYESMIGFIQITDRTPYDLD